MFVNYILYDNKNIVFYMVKNNYKKFKCNLISCKNKVIDLKLIKLGIKIKLLMIKS